MNEFLKDKISKIYIIIINCGIKSKRRNFFFNLANKILAPQMSKDNYFNKSGLETSKDDHLDPLKADFGQLFHESGLNAFTEGKIKNRVFWEFIILN